MSKVPYLRLRSVDRTTNSTSTALCSIILPNNVYGIKKVSLLEFIVPNMIFNIVTGKNDRICWRRSSTDYSYQIAGGNYSITTLLALIGPGMTAIDANNFSWSVDTTTGRVTVSGTGAFVLNWATNPNAATGAYYVLGFAASDTASATSQTGTNSIQLNVPPYLDIVVAPLTSPVMISNGKMSTFNISTGDAGSGDSIHWTLNQQYEQTYSYVDLTLNQIDIMIFESGRVNLANLNNCDWEMLLKLEY